MRELVSEDAHLMHEEHLYNLRLRYSIYESDFKCIKNKNLSEISRQKLDRTVKNEVLRLGVNILMHEICFDSFSLKGEIRCPPIHKSYGSVAAFLYELYKRAMLAEYGFIYVSATNRGVELYSDLDTPIPVGEPLLALDTCEHAYFLDYGFDKERYIKAALEGLRLDKINDFYENR